MENPGNKSCNLCRATGWIFVFFFFFVGIILFFVIVLVILLFVFSSDGPEFRVDSFSLSNFTLVRNDSSSAKISLAAQVQLTARNPNKFVTLSFGRTDANVYYRSSRPLGPTEMPPSLGPIIVLPPFSLGPKSQAPLTASFAAVVETRGVRNIGKVARFDVRLLSSVRYKEEVVGRRSNHSLKVFCDGLVVGIPSHDNNINGRTPGGSTDGGAPRPCCSLLDI